MQTLLHIRTSLFSQDGESSRLANQYVTRWQAANPAGRIMLRDLAVEPVPHLSAERFTAFTMPAAERTAEQAAPWIPRPTTCAIFSAFSAWRR